MSELRDVAAYMHCSPFDFLTRPDGEVWFHWARAAMRAEQHAAIESQPIPAPA